jgi:LysM repeat protein
MPNDSKLDDSKLDDSKLASADTTPRSVPKLTSVRPEISDGGAGRHVTEKGANPTHQALPENATQHNEEDRAKAKKLFAVGMQANEDGDLVAARAHLTDAVSRGLSGEQLIEARAALTRIGNETIFGPNIIEGDPFVSRYTIKSGDLLSKVAANFSVTDDFLAAINGIADKNRIRVGQNIKVVHGPFHAKIDPAAFSMDIYLNDTFVRHYKVGLGEHGSTPTGKWRVGDKIVNPTYHPPRGGKLILADDPENPLGERWIKLNGIEGNAVGQTSYGIHGTIDPDSIGRNKSMGCVRMHNEDVAEVFTYLSTDKSIVDILED